MKSPTVDAGIFRSRPIDAEQSNGLASAVDELVADHMKASKRGSGRRHGLFDAEGTNSRSGDHNSHHSCDEPSAGPTIRGASLRSAGESHHGLSLRSRVDTPGPYRA